MKVEGGVFIKLKMDSNIQKPANDLAGFCEYSLYYNTYAINNSDPRSCVSRQTFDIKLGGE